MNQTKYFFIKKKKKKQRNNKNINGMDTFFPLLYNPNLGGPQRQSPETSDNKKLRDVN